MSDDAFYIDEKGNQAHRCGYMKIMHPLAQVYRAPTTRMWVAAIGRTAQEMSEPFCAIAGIDNCPWCGTELPEL